MGGMPWPGPWSIRTSATPGPWQVESRIVGFFRVGMGQMTPRIGRVSSGEKGKGKVKDALWCKTSCLTHTSLFSHLMGYCPEPHGDLR